MKNGLEGSDERRYCDDDREREGAFGGWTDENEWGDAGEE